MGRRRKQGSSARACQRRRRARGSATWRQESRQSGQSVIGLRRRRSYSLCCWAHPRCAGGSRPLTFAPGSRWPCWFTLRCRVLLSPASTCPNSCGRTQMTRTPAPCFAARLHISRMRSPRLRTPSWALSTTRLAARRCALLPNPKRVAGIVQGRRHQLRWRLTLKSSSGRRAEHLEHLHDRVCLRLMRGM